MAFDHGAIRGQVHTRIFDPLNAEERLLDVRDAARAAHPRDVEFDRLHGGIVGGIAGVGPRSKTVGFAACRFGVLFSVCVPARYDVNHEHTQSPR